MQLLLIRHGLPEKIIREDGSPADPPLSERGHAQAVHVGAWLETERVDRVISSPLQRARQTALPLARAKGLELELDARIAEYDRDSETYIPLEELKATDYASWKQFMETGYPPGVDLDAFFREVVEGLESIIASSSGRNVAVFCHGGVINAFASHVLGIEQKLFFNPGYTSINRFLAAGSGVRSIGSLNEVAHLRGL